MTGDTTETDEDLERIRDHLETIDDGCGCTEVWEHLSDSRADD